MTKNRLLSHGDRSGHTSSTLFLAVLLTVLRALPGALGGDEAHYRDVFPDTWVARDALGRDMPAYSEVGPVK